MNLKTVIAKHLAVSAAPPSTPPRCKNITAKWERIRGAINTAYAAGQQQIDGLTYGTLGQVWEFETWNSQNGNTLPPEIFKFSIENPYNPPNTYPPAAAAQNPQLAAPEAQNDPNLAKKEKLLACIKTLRKCALLRGYKDLRSGKYIRGKWDMLYAAAVLEAIELARSGCEPYSTAGGIGRNPTNKQKKEFFKAQINSITEGVRSALGAPCKPCQPTQTAPAGVNPQ